MSDNTNLGLGVMINMLGGNADTVAAVNAALGKTISHVRIQEDLEPDGALVFTFVDGTGLIVYDNGHSCCESRWMHTDDNLEDHIGAELRAIEVRPGPTTTTDTWGDPQESQFLVVTTSRGAFTVVNYNQHNGYYGGFWMVARLTPAPTQPETP